MIHAASGLVAWALLSSSPAASSKEPPPAATSTERSRLRPGLFLYAAPGLLEPRFAQTVVLLIEHGPQGSMGLVVNRPTEVPLHEALDEAKGAPGQEAPLYWGGPVQPEAVFALVRNRRPRAGARSVIPEVQLTADLAELRRARADKSAHLGLRVYAGYAGWTAGQLQDEVRAGAWVLDRAEADPIFAVDPSSLWRRVYKLLDRQQVLGRPAAGRASGP